MEPRITAVGLSKIKDWLPVMIAHWGRDASLSIAFALGAESVMVGA
jgi:hypothetical protein